MLWLLLCLPPLVGCSRLVTQDVPYEERHDHDDVAVTTLPHIYYCRSPNMEDFTCWWHPLSNLTDGEEVTHVLTYAKENGHGVRECPDYVTGGPNSCHFNSDHTAIWTVYCMNVTAVTARRNYTSPEHCVDVADIVQTEAPANLSYWLTDAGGDELGHKALLSWTYPVPSHLQYGWITLVYELQYRRVNEPDNWKVKHPLREPSVELLGLPAGDYVVRVRCRSHNYGLWSKWSSTLLMSIPARPPAGKLLVLILVTGVGVVALLGIVFVIVPHSKRIKEYLLPPIPKPRIIGIDPLLLKKGHLDEINRHFSNFHSYRPPSYTEEVWDQVSTDDMYLSTLKDSNCVADRGKDALMVPRDTSLVAAPHQLTTRNPPIYVQSLPPYCSSPPQGFSRSVDVPSLWPRPEVVTLPGTNYSMMGHPSIPHSVPAPEGTTLTTNHSPQDFYTCVQLMNESGEVHLVPCLPPDYCSEFQSFPRFDLNSDEKEVEKKKQLDEYRARNNLMNGSKDGGGTEGSEAAVPLLPVTVDNND